MSCGHPNPSMFNLITGKCEESRHVRFERFRKSFDRFKRGGIDATLNQADEILAHRSQGSQIKLVIPFLSAKLSKPLSKQSP
jgi:hypothetical protein